MDSKETAESANISKKEVFKIPISVKRATPFFLLILLFLALISGGVIGHVNDRGFDSLNNEWLVIYDQPNEISMIDLKLTPPTWNPRRDYFTITVNSVSQSTTTVTFDFVADEVCLDRIFIIRQTEANRHHGTSVPERGWPDTCVAAYDVSDEEGFQHAVEDTFDLSNIDVEDRTFTLTDPDYDPFFYPFDKFQEDIGIILGFTLRNDGNVIGRVLFTTYFVLAADKGGGWVIKGESRIEDFSDFSRGSVRSFSWGNTYEYGVGQKFGLSNSHRELRLTAYRPLIYRLAYPFVIFVMLLLICSLVFLKNTGVFLGAVTGVFFGIFGIRQVIIPPGAEAETLLDLSMLILYLLLTVVVLHHLLTRVMGWKLGSPASEDQGSKDNKTQKE